MHSLVECRGEWVAPLTLLVPRGSVLGVGQLVVVLVIVGVVSFCGSIVLSSPGGLRWISAWGYLDPWWLAGPSGHRTRWGWVPLVDWLGKTCVVGCHGVPRVRHPPLQGVRTYLRYLVAMANGGRFSLRWGCHT